MSNILIHNRDLTPEGRLKEQYPDIDGHFSCSGSKITSLDGSPVKVGKYFNCFNTPITSLDGAPMIIGEDFYCSKTNITSLQGIGRDYLLEIGGDFILNECPKLKSHMLGIMLVKKLKGIMMAENLEMQIIFNNHLSGDRDLLDCKEELMNKGFKEFARL